jgi:uncharacterized protein
MSIKSPCKKLCRVKEDMCSDCYRTLSEISNWSIYSDDEKINILKRVKERNLKR